MRFSVLSFSLLALLACGPELSPEEELDLQRSRYTADLQGFTVKQVPLSVPATDDSTTAPGVAAPEEDAPAAAGNGGEGDDAEFEPPPGLLDSVEVTKEVILDILVSVDGDDYLPGVTVDLSHIDKDGNEKNVHRLWLDTAGVTKGSGRQVTQTLPDVDYEPGDGFYVEVRYPIAPAERSEYREFSAVQSSSGAAP